MKQTLNEEIGRIKQMMNLNEDDSQQMAVLQQATQEFNEKAEEDLTPEELQEVACTDPDTIEAPQEATNEQKQMLQEFKKAVKTAKANRDILGLKKVKNDLKEFKNKYKQAQNEQVAETALISFLGVSMPPAFAMVIGGIMLIIVLNVLLSLFGIGLVKTITYWCTGKRTTGYGLRFGRN
jgi:hypothetical protein